MTEMLDLVNQNDQVIGSESRDIIYTMGLHNYRVIGVFLIDRERKILLPARSMHCSYCPGCFDFSVAGHVLTGETYHSAAERELQEELGIESGALELQEFLYAMYPNPYGLSSFSKYYYAYYTGEFSKCSNEISGYRWLPAEDITQRLAQQPEMFKSDFAAVFGYFLDHVYLTL